MSPALLRLCSMLAVSSAFRRAGKRDELSEGTNISRGSIVASRSGLKPCINNDRSQSLIFKQYKGEKLTRQEAIRLIQKADGVPGDTCGAAKDTTLARTRQGDGCIEKGKVYTVCYNTNSNHDYVGPEGDWHCGIFYGGAQVIREDGGIDCLGGCNEERGKKSCGVEKHRFSCMAHDVCSVVQDAKGFILDRHCGNEAAAAFALSGACNNGDVW